MNHSFVDVISKGRFLEVIMNTQESPLIRLDLYLNERPVGSFPAAQRKALLPLNLPLNGKNTLVCKGLLRDGTVLSKEFHLEGQHVEPADRDFKPGDILIACDNMGSLPPGLMGHSAIVINSKTIIESVSTKPYIRKYPISGFMKEHPLHAQYRPKDSKVGIKARNYAIRYLNWYRQNRKKGIERPTFSFSSKIPLKNVRRATYCSKLVWLCYANGAKIEFENDHYLFSPEDLDRVLVDNPDFTKIYRHHNFDFLIDS